MANLVLEIIGWLGTVMVLVAYLLLTKGKIESTSKTYQLLNLIGPIGIGLNAFVNRAYPAVGINVAWSLIAVYGLTQAFRG